MTLYIVFEGFYGFSDEGCGLEPTRGSSVGVCTAHVEKIFYATISTTSEKVISTDLMVQATVPS